MIVRLLNLIDAVRFRLRRGHWCAHTRWTRWHIADAGRFKHRTCLGCGRWETA